MTRYYPSESSPVTRKVDELFPHPVHPDAANLIWSWFQSRQGISIWASVNLSNPGRTWTTPRFTAQGDPAPKPSWEADSLPLVSTDDPNDCVVDVPKEVKRFHVAVRRGSQGLSLKLTDGSTRKVERALEKAGENSWYAFDYMTQECVIYVPASTMPLPQWIKENSTNPNPDRETITPDPH